MTPQNGVPAPAPVDAPAAAEATSPRSAPAAAPYVRRPVRVDARRVSHTNAAEIADWCGGTVLANAVRVPYMRGENRWELLAKPGAWVVIELEGAGLIDVLSDVEFAHDVKQVRP